ncbi:MAG TPA: flagellin [Pirellulales bacterium]|jgi:flagellin|nr:flagellin [Pirellulales bacterium]
MTRINTNVSALIAEQNLATANNQLQTSLTRLSTGLQINSGADNPSGLIAAASLGSDITGVQQGINNSQLATEIISTADGGLSQVQQLLNTIQGLVNESANTGALSTDQIAANQLQVDSSLQAIDTIANTTTFQGKQLLDGSLNFINTSPGTQYSSISATLASASGVKASVTYGTANAGFTLTAVTAGTAANNTKIVAATGSGTTTVKLTSYVSSSHTYNEVKISFKTAASAADVISAINATTAVSALFTASVDSAGSATASFAPVGTTTVLTGGAAAGAIKVSTVAGTSDYNGLALKLVSGAASGSETAAFTASNNTLTVNIDSGVSSTTAVATAINALSGQFASTVVTAGTFAATSGAASLFTGSTSSANISNLQINQANFGTQSSVGVDVKVNSQATQGTLTYSGGTLTSNVVLQVGGDDGYNVFNFDSGTTKAQIASAINGVSDATGVGASVDGSGNLVFKSTDYGSSAFASVQAISGTFNTVNSSAAAATRATGTDVAVTVNGVAATGNGLEASINTPTLDLSFSVATALASGSSFNFSITGGGANFQIGPDVVSNDQARLGIQSVSTAQLGGVDGSLYELQSGGTLSLANNPSGAASVVNEALSEITSLRGRLGAFQSTTLQTNINTLQTTLSNLTSAQSNIQDTDFASETSSLTRAQILVQSSTQVLQIANSNPQNVLKLLQNL